MLLVSTFLVAVAALLFAHWAVFKHLETYKSTRNTFTKSWKQAWLVSLVLALAVTAGLTYSFISFVLFLTLPFIGTFLVSVFHTTESSQNAWNRTWRLLRKGYARLIVILGFFAIANSLISMVIAEVFGELLNQFLSNFVIPGGSEFLAWYLIPGLFSTITQFTFTVLIYIAFHLSFFTLKEIDSAAILKQRIDEQFPSNNKDERPKVSLLRKDILVS